MAKKRDRAKDPSEYMDLSGKEYAYLEHFRQPKHLDRGHNFSGGMGAMGGGMGAGMGMQMDAGDISGAGASGGGGMDMSGMMGMMGGGGQSASAPPPTEEDNWA